MPDSVSKQQRLVFAAIFAAMVVCGLFVASGAVAGQSVGGLSGQLGQTQAHEQTLSGSIAALNGQVSQLDGQIALVQRREENAQATLSSDDAAVMKVKIKLGQERKVLLRLKAKLARAQKILDHQLVSQYEQPQQSLFSVVLNSHGFGQLLSQLQYLKTAQQRQQAVINYTRKAKDQTQAAELRVSKLASDDITAAQHARTQEQALAGMKSLLNSRESALASARSEKAQALAATQAHGSALQAQINHIHAEQAAAARRAAAQLAAQQQAAQQSTDTAGSSTPTSSLGSTAGWAIPYAIVLCESGGQNLPPNSAGASGYYQIIPSTWSGEGGSGPAAYLASKAEQYAIAAKIWDGGAGASNWVCASIVGDD